MSLYGIKREQLKNNYNNVKQNLLEATFLMQSKTKISVTSLQTILKITNTKPTIIYKKLSYRWGTTRCIVLDEILPIATQQCRNYLYDKSWTNRSYEVTGLRWSDV